ncbi:MAG: penicillin-binding transpeptidase domain-containing protein, partial [Acidimicrobiales bacterium]
MRIVILVSFSVLALRLIIVQGLSANRYSAIGTAEVTSTVQVPAARGGIYDRNGAALAISVPRSTVVADPFLIQHPAAEASVLAPALGVPASTLQAAMSQHSGFVYLAHKVDDATATKVEALKLAGINLLPDSQRIDPAGQLALPVLGIVGSADSGLSGLEYRYEATLAGHSGSLVVQRTPDNVPLPGNASQSAAAAPGRGLELTLDEPLQSVTEQSLGAEVLASHAKSGIAIIMDSHTGDVLAMANLAFDPATNQVVEAPSNFAVTRVYEPGSVFKIVTFSAALEAGVVSPQQVFS